MQIVQVKTSENFMNEKCAEGMPQVAADLQIS